MLSIQDVSDLPEIETKINEENTKSSFQNQIYLKKPIMICGVCGYEANCKHFGVFACDACAAFFRRTIAKKLIHICMYNGNCLHKASKFFKI